MKPLFAKRFWFYNDWDGGLSTGTDEYGYNTVVIPLGKGRAICVATFPGYLWCEDCAEGRRQTLAYEQDNCYVQTYWNIEDYDDVFDMSNEEWDEALGIVRV